MLAQLSIFFFGSTYYLAFFSDHTREVQYFLAILKFCPFSLRFDPFGRLSIGTAYL